MTLPYSEDVIKLNPQLVSELKTQPASKYHNVREEMKGLRFQSGHEAKKMGDLMLLDEKHLIFGLRLQVKFPLPGGQSWTADAVFLEFDEKIGQLRIRVVDAKGVKTEGYRIKKKLFEEKYDIPITEL